MLIQDYMLIGIEISIILVILSLISLIRTIKVKINQDMLKLPQAHSLSEITNLIDSFITIEFENYKINYLAHKDIYINREHEKKIMNDIIERVSKNLSLPLLNSLSLYYNKDSISDLIAEKVYFVVSLYVSQNNKIIDDTEHIKQKTKMNVVR